MITRYHTPAWATAVLGTGRWTDASRAYLLDDGSHVVLPLYRHRRAPAWLASPPYGWGFGGLTGPRAQDPTSWPRCSTTWPA